MKQKYIKPAGMVAFIAYMQMFVPLSIDLYLPALPEMAGVFSASEFLVNLTLAGFFLVFAVGIILFGPLADKYGRRKVLLTGAACYTMASLGCAFSPSIYALIGWRLLQALGAGAIITVSTALIKDCFRGALMKKILAITQALSVIAPTCAPLLGGFLLTFTDWRGAFLVLTLLGVLTFVVSLLLTETLREGTRFTGSIFSSFRLFSAFLRRGRFMGILVMFSLLAAPYMAYLSVSSFVYIDEFHLTPQMYSLYYAVNSAAAVAGPILYLRLTHSASNQTITRLAFALSALSAILLYTFGDMGPLCFLLGFLPFTIVESVIRPFAMDVLLNIVKKDAGTASALINFVPTLLGSLGMMAGTLPWPDFIMGLAILLAFATSGAIVIYCFIREV